MSILKHIFNFICTLFYMLYFSIFPYSWLNLLDLHLHTTNWGLKYGAIKNNKINCKNIIRTIFIERKLLDATI